MDDEDTPRKLRAHTVGEDLATLSIDELEERVELLKTEIARLGEAIAGKRASAAAADAFFKPKG